MAGTGSGRDDPWRISGEDRAKHDSQFYQLKPVNGFVTGEQARGFFLQSGLPNQVLGQIWTLADMNGDGKMDKKEFSIAMHLIKKKLQGYELPRNIPASLKADPSPVMGSFGAQPMNMGMGAQPVGGFGMGRGMVPMSMGLPSASLQTGTSTTGAMGMPLMANGVAPGMPQQAAFRAPGMAGVGMAPPTGVPQATSGSWAIPHPSKLKYTQLFNTNDRNKRGFLTGVEARAILVQTGLPQPVLAQLWTLSDVDNDGKLTCDEFCIALHLADVARLGRPLPPKLPPELIPQGMKGAVAPGGFPPPPTACSAPGGPPPQKDAFGDLLGGFGMPAQQPPMPVQPNGDMKEDEDARMPVTFEDRRKDNFDRGQAELEKRRQMLQEQMKREEAERQEKERKEQEKRDRIRREQEEKRQRELERQMEKHRQIEQEREEQRRKMMEQREAARRELERQRQMEWERQRKEQLLIEKQREHELLVNLKSEDGNLKCQLEALDGKKAEIVMKVNQVRNGVTELTSSIESMRSTRDSKMAEMERLQNELQTLSQRLGGFTQTKDQLNMQVQSMQTTPLSDTHRTVMHSVEQKKTNVLKLKKELEQIEKDTETRLTEIDQFNIDLKKSNDMIHKLQKDIPMLQNQQKLKLQQDAQLKRDQEIMEQQEKERQERLKREVEAQDKQKKEESVIAKSEPAKDDNWFDFNSTQATANDSQDNWATAFSSSTTSTSNSTWPTDGFSSQPSTTSTCAKTTYKALYDFEARGEDELNLFANDIILVPDDQGAVVPGMEEWFKGEKDGKTGWFPKAYVEKADTAATAATAATEGFGNEFDSTAVTTSVPNDSNNTGLGLPTSLDSSFTAVSPTPGQGQIAPDGLTAKATYPWKARQDNHLTFNKDDTIIVKEQQDMWWLGELNGKTGWFPKAYVKLISVGAKESVMSPPAVTNIITQETHGSNTSSPVPSDKKDGEYYVAMYAYVSAEPADLNFNEGEMILVTEAEGDWWTGSVNDKTGVFPANYVKKVEIQVGDGDGARDTLRFSSSEFITNTKADPLNVFGSTESETVKPAKSMDDLLSDFNFDFGKPSVPSKSPSMSQRPQSANILDPIARIKSEILPTTRPQSTGPYQQFDVPSLQLSPKSGSAPTSRPQSTDPYDCFRMPELQPKSQTSSNPQLTDLSGLATSKQAEITSQSADPYQSLRNPENATGSNPTSRPQSTDPYDSLRLSESPVPNVPVTLPQSADPYASFRQTESQTQSPAFAGDPFTSNNVMKDSQTSENTFESTDVDPFSSFGDAFSDLKVPQTFGQNTMLPMGSNNQTNQSNQSPLDLSSLSSTTVTSTNLDQMKGKDAFDFDPFGSFTQSTASSFDTVKSASATQTPTPSLAAQTTIFGGDPFASNSVSTKQAEGSTGMDDMFNFGTTTKHYENIPTSNASIYENVLDTTNSTSMDLNNSASIPDTTTVTDTTGAFSAEVAGLMGGPPSSIPTTLVTSSPTNTLEPGQKTSKKPEIAMVIAPYTATGAGQLTLETGNLIQVRQKSPRGWWEGELQARGQKKKIGWFPANYVKLLGPSSARSTPDTGLSAALNVSQQNSRSATPVSTSSQSSQPAAPVSANTTSETVERVKTLYAYTSQNDDELTFQKDSVMTVLNKDNNDWWQGELENGQIGMFPSNYVVPYTENSSFTRENRDSNSLIRNLSPTEKNRQNYIQELINTEQTYIDDISFVREVFQKPLVAANVITEEESQQLFVNLQDLIISSTKLIKALRVRKKMSGKGKAIHMIGDILCENLPHMTPYVRFCSCQLTAAALLQHKFDNFPAFNEAHRQCLQDPRTKNMPLSSFLLKPMQRITKYPLMIKQILKYTPEDHADHQNLVDALARAEELCSQVNEGVREKDNSDQLEWIQKHVHCDNIPEKITFNSVTNSVGPRKLLHSGLLYKVKSNKELMGFLFNDFLLLTQPSKSLGNNISSHMLFSPKSTLHFKIYKIPMLLTDITLRKPTEEDSDPCHFQVCHTDRIFNFRALTETERDLWSKHLEMAVNQHKKTVQKKIERAHSTSMRIKAVGRLLVIILEGIGLQSTHNTVRRTPGVGRLLVVILEGSNLKASDQNGKSDPYCEVSMGSQEHRTKVVPGTLNPKWNNSMQFTIKDLNQDVLCISVFDQDIYSPNDFLGRTEIRVKEVLAESKARRGPITKRLSLLEVDSGEVVVKLDLQLYET